MSDSEGSQKRGTAGNVADYVQRKAAEVSQEDFGKAKALVGSAVKSGSFFYPIRGIIYFLTHRALWKPLASRILPTLGLSIGVVAGMFTFAYLPQLAIMVFVNGPLAVFTTVFLVLSESSTLINVISRNFLLQDVILDTFDGTLVSRGSTDIVQNGRQLKSGSDPVARLGKLMKSPFERFSPKALIRYVMYLPLNFIPIVGTVIFILLQGRSRGNGVHDRYFQLKNMSASQRTEWLNEHRGPYAAFGVVATLLEMVPVASIFFAFTNAVGAALWAADIEEKGTKMTSSTAPELRQAAKKAD